MTPYERVTLMQRIAVARAITPPRPWKQIAADEGRPVRTLQRLHSQHEAQTRRPRRSPSG